MNEQQEREAFEAAFKHFDLASKPDAWGNPMYLHSHVDAIWAGFKTGSRWQARSKPAANETVPSRATDIATALNRPGCERLRDFAAVGPVQRAAVEEFAYALAANVPADHFPDAGKLVEAKPAQAQQSDATAILSVKVAHWRLRAEAAERALADKAKPEAQQPIGQLFQHGETGRTRVVMHDQIADCDAAWFKVGDLVLAGIGASGEASNG